MRISRRPSPTLNQVLPEVDVLDVLFILNSGFITLLYLLKLITYAQKVSSTKVIIILTFTKFTRLYKMNNYFVLIRNTWS